MNGKTASPAKKETAADNGSVKDVLFGIISTAPFSWRSKGDVTKIYKKHTGISLSDSYYYKVTGDLVKLGKLKREKGKLALR